jgi:hypothetical protein
MEFIVAFILYVVVFLVGMQVARRRAVKPKLMCGCNHHLSSHSPKTGVCGEVTVRFTGNGQREVGRYVCPCLIYTGDYPADWQARLMQIEMNRKELR